MLYANTPQPANTFILCVYATQALARKLLTNKSKQRKKNKPKNKNKPFRKEER